MHTDPGLCGCQTSGHPEMNMQSRRSVLWLSCPKEVSCEPSQKGQVGFQPHRGGWGQHQAWPLPSHLSLTFPNYFKPRLALFTLVFPDKVFFQKLSLWPFIHEFSFCIFLCRIWWNCSSFLA